MVRCTSSLMARRMTSVFARRRHLKTLLVSFPYSHTSREDEAHLIPFSTHGERESRFERPYPDTWALGHFEHLPINLGIGLVHLLLGKTPIDTITTGLSHLTA